MCSDNSQSLDAVIVGAGFSGIYLLHKLRTSGFNVKVFESSEYLGGVWYQNCYPGARVDSESQIYQFSAKFDSNIWKNYHWKEFYPDWKELQEYFCYVDSVLNLSKDIYYNTRVTSATFDEDRNQWLVKSIGTDAVRAKYLFLCTGFGAKRYTPDFKGLESFKGESYHTASWPRNGLDLTGKKVAVIGTGASGVQVIQEIGGIVDHLTVYQRTPNIAFPMKNTSDMKKIRLTDSAQIELFDLLPNTFGGFPIGFDIRSALGVTPSERQSFYEERYAAGGLGSWVGTFIDVLFVQEANDTAYEFWVEKTRVRIQDPVKKDILAPLTPPHPFGAKRPSLEVKYFEVCDQSNVTIIDVQKSPIIEVTEDGVRTEKEGVVPADVIVLATGFDSYTGGILDIAITNGKGLTLKENWSNGVRSNIGMAVAGFPNMFYTYGPQAPTAFLNGPTSAEVQGEWLLDLVIKMRDENQIRVETTREAEDEWIKVVQDAWTNSLLPKAESWYQGSNIPGKKIEAYNFVGGLPVYREAMERSASNNYNGFIIN